MIAAPRLLRAGILIAALLLALAYGLAGLWVGILAALAAGVWAWYGLALSGPDGSPEKFLAGYVLLIVIGAYDVLQPFLLVTAFLAVLICWDLARFQGRLTHAPDSEGIGAIESHHLQVLGAAVLVGGAAAGVLLVLRLQMGFGLVLLLAVVLVVSFSEVIRLFRN